MNANPNLSWKVIVLLVAVMATLVFWNHSRNGRFVLTTSNVTAGMFLIDTATGDVWRYYRNPDETEGFGKLQKR